MFGNTDTPIEVIESEEVKTVTSPQPVATRTVKRSVNRRKSKKKASRRRCAGHLANLASRKDVVNKTILRALRRFIINKFKGFQVENPQYKFKKDLEYLECIKVFVAEEFPSHQTHASVLQCYIGTIIFPKLMTAKLYKECGLDQDEGNVLYDSMYKYSHTRLLDLLQNETVGLIFEYFYNDSLDQTLDSEPAMQKNKEVYRQTFKNFMDAFNHEIEASALVTN